MLRFFATNVDNPLVSEIVFETLIKWQNYQKIRQAPINDLLSFGKFSAGTSGTGLLPCWSANVI